MPWIVEKRVPIKRGVLETGACPTFGWERDLYYPPRETRRAAKAAVAVSLYPELASAPEDFAVTHFDQWARNVKTYRVRHQKT